MESCYFGAQTLRTKIQFAFHELPPETHSQLRDSMLNHLENINEHTNTVIVTQVLRINTNFYSHVVTSFAFCHSLLDFVAVSSIS